jgi:hypothetical protein
LVVAWVVFPLVLLAVCLGCGLAVERAGAWQLPGPLIPAVGLALVIVASALTSSHVVSAPFTTALVVVLAAAGYALGWDRWRRLRPDPWTLAVGIGVYAICAAPVVLSGNATFLGYFVDSDPAFHFELLTWMLAHGHDLHGLPFPSLYAVPNLLREYIDTAYPTGADVAVGAIRPLVGQDVAWIYQPYLAVTMALGAVALEELLRDAVRPRSLRALSAFVAAQGSLAYAFYLEASVKEVVVALLITVTVVLVLRTLRRPFGLRSLAPLTVVVLGALDVYSVTIVPWLGPPLAVFLGAAGWRWRRRAGGLPARRVPRRLTRPMAAWAAAGLLVIVLASPVIAGAATFANAANTVLGQANVLGNLAAPLSNWQLLGIWPSGDFRYAVLSETRPGYALMGVALAGAVLGVIWMVRRRTLAPLLLLLGDGIAAAFLLERASPYAAGKVLMLLSIAVVLVAMLGGIALHDAGRRIEGWLLAGLIAAGVLWSNFLAYHDSSVAPQARLRELASIGTRFAGRGPAFYDLWDTFAVYFLRRESVAVPDTFAGPAPARPGLPAHPFGQASPAWDPNDLPQYYLQSFRLLVLGRSPLLSRPPANYRLVYRGRYYDVWQKAFSPRVLRHDPLAGSGLGGSHPASCSMINATAGLAAREHARLAYVLQPAPPILVPSRARHPAGWIPTAVPPREVPQFLSVGQSSGRVTGTIRVPRSGRYQVWLSGSISRRVLVFVGGHLVGTLVHQIASSGQFLMVGTVELDAGSQPVDITRPPSTLAPGNVLGGDMIGPLVLVAGKDPPPVQELAPKQAGGLCGRRLEWLEVVA